jgi:hypothetical protein
VTSRRFVVGRLTGLQEEEMNRDARLMSGILLATVPTIQYGGYFLLRLFSGKCRG